MRKDSLIQMTIRNKNRLHIIIQNHHNTTVLNLDNLSLVNFSKIHLGRLLVLQQDINHLLSFFHRRFIGSKNRVGFIILRLNSHPSFQANSHTSNRLRNRNSSVQKRQASATDAGH
ncbi:Protein of unknown function [Cotesia congregata]|uniref:Uncharacterized protein n=1 Tax=Cotesia congregata TaxID=51543 RepID=A0A8J2HS96_COTCN|nr:Protein of unknown function [Cotesia congregata]